LERRKGKLEATPERWREEGHKNTSCQKGSATPFWGKEGNFEEKRAGKKRRLNPKNREELQTRANPGEGQSENGEKKEKSWEKRLLVTEKENRSYWKATQCPERTREACVRTGLYPHVW